MSKDYDKKTKDLLSFQEDPQYAIFSQLRELNEKKAFDGIETIKGKDGRDGKDGKDGKPGPQGPKGERGEQGPEGRPGKDGKDGEDGLDGVTPNINDIVLETLSQMPDVTGENLIQKINSVDKKGPKIDASHIENLPQSVTQVIETGGFRVGGFETPIKAGTNVTVTKDAFGAYVISSASSSLTLTTTGSSGVATYDSNTGILNIPNYSSGSGGITRTIVTTSGNVTAGASAATDYVYLVAGAHTVTLPTAVSNTNRYTLKNNHSAAITVDTTSSQTIDGTTSIQIAPEDAVDIISNNSNWFVI